MLSLRKTNKPTSYQRARAAGSAKRAVARALLRRTAAPASDFKHVDVNTSGNLTVAVPFVIGLVNGIAQGASYFQRVGNRVQSRYIDLNLHLINNNAQPCRVRAMLVWDKQPAAALASEIIQDVTSAGATTTTAFAGKNSDNSLRFHTLMDKFVDLGPTGTDTGSYVSHDFRPVRDTQAFKGATDVLGDVATGAIYLFLFADLTGANTVAWWINTRYRYTDY